MIPPDCAGADCVGGFVERIYVIKSTVNTRIHTRECQSSYSLSLNFQQQCDPIAAQKHWADRCEVPSDWDQVTDLMSGYANI